MHNILDYESSDGLMRYKSSRSRKAKSVSTKTVQPIFEPKPLSTNLVQVNALVDSFTVMQSGMPQRFNTIHEIPQVDSEEVSLPEKLFMSRW